MTLYIKGGYKNKGIYVFGSFMKQDKQNFICLDPHLVQSSCSEDNIDYKSYYKNDGKYFIISESDLKNDMTLGIYLKNIKEVNKFYNVRNILSLIYFIIVFK